MEVVKKDEAPKTELEIANVKIADLENKLNQASQAAQHWFEEAKKLQQQIGGLARVNLLSETIKMKCFPAEFEKAVKAEYMWRINGYDPDGIFKQATEQEHPTAPEEEHPTAKEELPVNE